VTFIPTKTTVHKSPTPSTVFVGAPDIVSLGGDTLLCKSTDFGPSAGTTGSAGDYNAFKIHRSTDGGETWTQAAALTGFFFGIFIAELCSGNDVVMLGNSSYAGDIVLMVSDDGGETWTSHLLFDGTGETYCVGETPYLVRDGVMHMGVNTGTGSNYPFEAVFVLSANLADDLTDPDSWSKSNVLTRVEASLPTFAAGWGVNEPNVVELPDGSMQLWARVDPATDNNEIPILAIYSWDGETLAHLGYKHWDGAYIKQQIRRDAVTGAWFCMRNSTPVNDMLDRRTLLVLDRSDDLVSWRRIAIMASTSAANYATVGYQYPSFQFLGNDIVALIRAAQPGVAANYHDSDAILFARVQNFRSL
jgi:hypothetical protein